MKYFALDGHNYPTIEDAIVAYCSGPCIDCQLADRDDLTTPCRDWARQHEIEAAHMIGCQIVIDGNTVSNNQTAKADAGKLEIDLVPPQIIRDIAQVRMYGNKKYKDPNNWMTVQMRRYVNALMRHALCFMEDPHSIDEESGIAHYKHMACNMAFICEMMEGKNETSKSSLG